MTAIDWKKVSQCPGYISLKAAYINDASSRSMRSKKELYKHFQWVIGRAKHYSIKLNKPIEDVLNDWEKDRRYWWLNYYQDCRQPLLHSNGIKSRGVRGLKKHRSREWWKKALIQLAKRNKQPPRWSMERKKRGY